MTSQARHRSSAAADPGARRRAIAGALAVGVIVAVLAAALSWIYSAILLVATLVAVAVVLRGPRVARRTTDRLPGPLRSGLGFGAAVAAATIALATVVAIVPVYLVRSEQGDQDRARILVRDADHELDSRDYPTARRYLAEALEADPDVPGVAAVRERMARLQAEDR